MKNFSYIHTDLYKYYISILKTHEINLRKTLKLMLADIIEITDNKILIPTYNYDFSKTKTYNYYKDKSHVGYFSEYFRGLFKENRTETPIFSDCSNFKLDEKNKSSNPFGKGSIFDELTNGNGKILTFGSSFAPSYIMYVENCIPKGPRYRFIKKFDGKLVKNKKKMKTEIKFYCRPLNVYFKYDLNKIKKDLIKEGILKKKSTENGFKYLSFYAKDFKEFALSKINKNNFYFLDKKTSTMIKTYLKKNYRISRLDFEKNV